MPRRYIDYIYIYIRPEFFANWEINTKIFNNINDNDDNNNSNNNNDIINNNINDNDDNNNDYNNNNNTLWR